MPESTTPPLRGRRGRDRRIAEQVAKDFAARHPRAQGRGRRRLRHRRGGRRGRGCPPDRGSRPGRRPRRPSVPRAPPGTASAAPRTGAGHRLPDLAGLPPLARRDRHLRRAAGTAREPRRHRTGRAPRRARRGPARRQVVPRGRDRDRGADRLDRPRRRDRRPRGRGTGRLAGRRGGRRGPRAPHRPGLRAKRARGRRDGGPGRGPGRLAQRRGSRDGRQRPGPPPAHDRIRRPSRRAQGAARRCPAPPGPAPARPVRPRLLARDGGRRAWRVRAARRHRGRLPAIDGAPDPDRVLRRRDRLAAGLRSDRPADDRGGRAHRPPARVGVPAPDRGRGRDPRASRQGGLAARRAARERTSPASKARRDDPLRPAAAGASRAMAVGDAAEVWAAQLAPATALDHVDPGHAPRARRARRSRRGRRVPVAPGRRAARPSSWRPASCPRTGRRPTCRRGTGRPGSSGRGRSS